MGYWPAWESLYCGERIGGCKMVVMQHLDVDDLGLAKNAASLANGNSGAREACCIVGITK